MWLALQMTTLMIIWIQDMKYHAVTWFLFPLLLLLNGLNQPNEAIVERSLINIGLITGMLLMLTLYLSIRQQRLIWPFQGYFAWGDILLLYAFVPCFEPQVYLFFFTTGTLFTLCIHALITIRKRQKQIPFAGYLSLYAGVWFLARQLYPELVP